MCSSYSPCNVKFIASIGYLETTIPVVHKSSGLWGRYFVH